MAISEPARTDTPSPSPSPTEIPTLGVEEEFFLVDPRTGLPSPRNTEVAAIAAELGTQLQIEFNSSQIETATTVGTHIQDLRGQLCESRAATADAAARAGCELLAVGTPIFDPSPDSITDTPRYRRMATSLGGLTTGVMCGCHVHVGVDDRAEGVQVINHLRPWLPTLLALTANSPISSGVDTGYASWRYIRFSRWPSAGPPPYFDSTADYDAAVAVMLETGSILDPGMVYWDVRSSNHLPTVEIRISDVPATIAETMTLATLVHALVITALGAIRRGDAAPRVGQDTLRGACWRAARDGLTGHGLDLATGRLVTAHQQIRNLLAHNESALNLLGEYSQVATSLAAVMDHGNGATQQRRSLHRRHDPADVVSECAARTLEGCIPKPGDAVPL